MRVDCHDKSEDKPWEGNEKFYMYNKTLIQVYFDSAETKIKSYHLQVGFFPFILKIYFNGRYIFVLSMFDILKPKLKEI